MNLTVVYDESLFITRKIMYLLNISFSMNDFCNH